MQAAANGIHMLTISATIMGQVNTIHPTLIWDTDTVILVDTGYPGQIPLFRAEMEKAGVPFEKLNKIIITHQDIDHIGSLPSILKEPAQEIEVLAHEIEKPYIQGERRLIKITAEALVQLDKTLPPEMPVEQRKALLSALENPPKGQVDRTIAGPDTLPYSGGIIVIETPGHTPGHISLYHSQSKTLIAGDAMIVADGQLFRSPPPYTLDSKLAQESLRQLSIYDIETVICYHGGLYKGNAKQRIALLANEELN
jgi:glyoxylase-like metal-dependent hydrolase (beta-lactamase superfamily II)